ncbi:transposable element Tcb2 transposase [Trichonephila clavipes]|nr:transposable element Tcb2 transposase [Trichonephila clavipes]
MMEAGWSARRVARQLGRSDCVVRRCWDQRFREMSFTRKQGSGRPRQTSRREGRHIGRNAPCFFSIHTKAPDGWTFGITAPITCAALDVLCLEWCCVRGN